MKTSSPGMELFNLEGKVVGSIPVPKVLEGVVNKAVLWQVVRQRLANERQGNADTKRRGEVRGGGKKPWRQKHSGRARAGTIRSPLWRKGGVVFGPHPREYRYELSQHMKRTALLHSLRAKLSSQEVAIVQGLDGIEPKTRILARLLRQVGAQKKTLVIVDKSAPVLVRISRNIRGVMIRPASDLSCYDVLASHKLVVTAEALKQLEGLQG